MASKYINHILLYEFLIVDYILLRIHTYALPYIEPSLCLLFIYSIYIYNEKKERNVISLTDKKLKKCT